MRQQPRFHGRRDPAAMKRTAVLLLVGLLCLSLCACADRSVPGIRPSAAAPTEEPSEEKTLTLAYDPNVSLHPITGTSPVNSMLTSLIYEGLFAPDEHFAPQPVLAAGASRDHSGTVWTVTLREGVVFSDGTPLEADHVAASINSARKSERYAERLKNVVSVRAADGQVVITLSVPNGTLPALLDIPVVLEVEDGVAPLGTGRYRWVDDPETPYLLKNYNRQDTLPYDRIGLYSVSNAAERISAFDSGAVSVVQTDFLSPYALGYSCSYEQWDYPTTDLLYLGFQCESEPFSSAPVRLAVAKAVDREAVVSDALEGYGDAAALPLPTGHADWCQAAAERLERDLSEAAELLAQAGYRKSDADGLLYHGRTPLAVTLLVNSESKAKLAAAELIAEELTQLGFTVTVHSLPWKDYTAALKAGDFDLYLGEVRLTGDFNVTELLTGDLNYGGYDAAASGLGALLAEQISYSGDTRAMASEDLWLSFAQEVPILPLCFTRESMLTRWEAKLSPTPVQSDLFRGLEA